MIAVTGASIVFSRFRSLTAGPSRSLASFERTKTDRVELREALDTVRLKGYALVDQELEIGLRSLAVPILDRNGRILAALNVGTHAARTRLDDMTSRFLPVLHDASRKITAQLPR